MDAVYRISETWAVDPLFKTLVGIDIYDVSRANFEDACWDLSGAEPYYDAIADQYNKIVGDLSAAKEYRAIRKAKRTRYTWMAGDWPEIATAAIRTGTLNVMPGTIYSLDESGSCQLEREPWGIDYLPAWTAYQATTPGLHTISLSGQNRSLYIVAEDRSSVPVVFNTNSNGTLRLGINVTTPQSYYIHSGLDPSVGQGVLTSQIENPSRKTITLDPNGGTWSTEDSSTFVLTRSFDSAKWTDSSVNLKPYTDNISRDGYSFAGWNVEKDGGRRIFSAEASLAYGDVSDIYGDITLYAQWIPKKDVPQAIFNTNGGSLTEEQAPRDYNELIIMTSSLGKTTTPKELLASRRLIGWIEQTSFNDSSDKFYLPNEEISITEDLVLYALWGDHGEGYSLVYDCNMDGAVFADSNTTRKLIPLASTISCEDSGSTTTVVSSSSIIYRQDHSVTVNRRVAGNLTKGKIVYFLADDQWRSVVVTAKEWRILQSKKVKFLRSQFQKAQTDPVGGKNLLTLMRPFVNLGRDDYILFVAFLVQSFSRSSSHYAAVISSSKGTGKSTLTKLYRSLIDPSESDSALTPSSEGDLKTLLAASYVACFDNTAALSNKYSDILCSSITGTKEAKRKLYTNADQIVLSLHNVIVVNGIDIVPRRSDLADRSLLFELRSISESNRKTDAEFWAAFDERKPEILGAIFDTLVKAMSIAPTLTITHKPRMADAFMEMTAIAIALGVSQSEFQRIFEANRTKLQEAYMQSSPLVPVMRA